MIYTIQPSTFGGPMRNGDLIAALNFLEYTRSHKGETYFHIPDNAIQSSPYVVQFRDWLKNNTDYLTDTPGDVFPVDNINLWDARSFTGDSLRLNMGELQKKIVIVPLLDAPYNVYRNWSIPMVNLFIEHYSQKKYKNHQKIILSDRPYDGINLQDFKYSHDFIDNLTHITQCSHYVGGDTGMSHFVSVLRDSPRRKINYYYGSVGLLHTTPFYALQGQGNINMFLPGTLRTDLL